MAHFKKSFLNRFKRPSLSAAFDYRKVELR